MANVSRLLDGAPNGADFLTELDIEARDDALLRGARRKVRDRLRLRIESWTRQNLDSPLTPKFFTQGSFAYKTINYPAWLPPQQMDMDDGIYLPMTFVKGEKPSVAAATFFGVVDSALEELIREEGWQKLVKKPTCSRVVLNARAHIDVPLYAIPDEEFARLTKSMVMDSALARLDEDAAFMRSRRDSWDVLPSDKVLLAHRDEDWKASDPRKIHDWFVNAVELYGEKLRRQCRYLKAWRDHHKLNHISSITLMAYVWQVFKETSTDNVPRREDLMLLKIAQRLPEMFQEPIANPVEPDELLGDTWSREERQEAIERAEEMLEKLSATVERCYLPQDAVEYMQMVFGKRIPDRPDLVSVEDAARAEICSHERAYVAAPMVGRSVSG